MQSSTSKENQSQSCISGVSSRIIETSKSKTETTFYGVSNEGDTRTETGLSTCFSMEDGFIVAVTEGRGVASEVGIAAFQMDTMTCLLYQVRRSLAQKRYLTSTICLVC